MIYCVVEVAQDLCSTHDNFFFCRCCHGKWFLLRLCKRFLRTQTPRCCLFSFFYIFWVLMSKAAYRLELLFNEEFHVVLAVCCKIITFTEILIALITSSGRLACLCAIRPGRVNRIFSCFLCFFFVGLGDDRFLCYLVALVALPGWCYGFWVHSHTFVYLDIMGSWHDFEILNRFGRMCEKKYWRSWLIWISKQIFSANLIIFNSFRPVGIFLKLFKYMFGQLKIKKIF